MKVAHSVVITPGACGLYETTKELVTGLRDRGVDSRMVDPIRRGEEDLKWAEEADVIVSHSGVIQTESEKPVVHVAHGRPRASWLNEKHRTKVYSDMYRANKENKYKAVVTFCPEHEPYLRVMFPTTPVHVIQSCVDLEAWNPDGASHYGFNGQGGRVNVVCADIWRDDLDPFIAINAFALWARIVPGVKLHLYGVYEEDMEHGVALLKTLENAGVLGEVQGHVKGLANVYRAAHCAVTTQNIDTRSVREALACGCPVVRFTNPVLNGLMKSFTDGLAQSRTLVRQVAMDRFDPAVTARQFMQVLDGVLA